MDQACPDYWRRWPGRAEARPGSRPRAAGRPPAGPAPGGPDWPGGKHWPTGPRRRIGRPADCPEARLAVLKDVPVPVAALLAAWMLRQLCPVNSNKRPGLPGLWQWKRNAVAGSE